MKNVIIEGMDGTGKSTLAILIAQAMDLPILHSDGPEKFPGEMAHRVRMFLNQPGSFVSDRHPIVSNSIYAPFRNSSGPGDPPHWMRDLMATKPFLIHCVPPPHIELPHVLKEVDTPQHQELITSKKSVIQALYRNWAARYRAREYHVGMDVKEVLNEVQAYFQMKD